MLFAVSLSAALLASAPPGPGSLTTSPREAAIVGGEKVAPEGWQWVVGLDLNGLICTGTVVSERVVLTAAHCLAANPDPEDIEVYFGNEMGDPTAETVAVDWGVHPDYCPSDQDGCVEDINDFAYLVLADRVTGISFPRVMGTQAEWDATMFIGGEVTLIGFGEDDLGLVGNKREVDTTIAAFTGTGAEFRAGRMGKDSCSGDSGGPAFVRMANNELVLAGVLSRGFEACGAGGTYGVPYPILCWLVAETNVDLTRDNCFCDCLITDPERGASSCAIGRPRGPQSAPLLLVVLALSRTRRRRA